MQVSPHWLIFSGQKIKSRFLIELMKDTFKIIHILSPLHSFYFKTVLHCIALILKCWFLLWELHFFYNGILWHKLMSFFFSHYYHEWAFMCDQERNSMLPTMAAGMQSPSLILDYALNCWQFRNLYSCWCWQF